MAKVFINVPVRLESLAALSPPTAEEFNRRIAISIAHAKLFPGCRKPGKVFLEVEILGVEKSPDDYEICLSSAHELPRVDGVCAKRKAKYSNGQLSFEFAEEAGPTLDEMDGVEKPVRRRGKDAAVKD